MALNSQQAKKAAALRWASHDWASMPLQDAIAEIAELRDTLEKASKIVQQRMTPVVNLTCTVCHAPIPQGRWCQSKYIRNPQTGFIDTIYFCSALCVTKRNKQEQNSKLEAMGVEVKAEEKNA